MDQGLELGFWLGILGLALSSAQVLLWRTRRVLNRSRPDGAVPEVGFVPAPVVQEVGLAPAPVVQEVGLVPAAVHKSG